MADHTKRQRDSSKALLSAVMAGDAEKVVGCLVDGAEVDSFNEHGLSALSLACSRGRVDLAEILLAAGADTEVVDSGGRAPLIIASAKGFSRIVELLVREGATVDAADRDSWTSLYSACRDGHIETVKVLLRSGASVEKANRFNRTPLFFASQNNHERIVRLLLKHGADKDAVDRDGWTSLFIASHVGNIGVVNALLEAGADHRLSTRFQAVSPLHIAARNGHADVVDALIRAGADANKSDGVHKTPFVMAIEGGHRRAIEALIRAGAHKGKDQYGQSALSAAIVAGSGLEILELMLRSGSDPNEDAATEKAPSTIPPMDSPDDGAMYRGQSRPPIFLAISRCDEALIKLLLHFGADPKATYRGHSTLMASLISFGHDCSSIVRLLLRAGVDPCRNARSQRVGGISWKVEFPGPAHDTPLTYAIKNDWEGVAVMLAAAGATATNEVFWERHMKPSMRQALLRTFKNPLFTFVTATHERIGDQSPVILLRGFSQITLFILAHALPDLVVDPAKQMPQLP